MSGKIDKKLKELKSEQIKQPVEISIRSVILTIVLSVSAAAIFFSMTITAAFSSELFPYIGALGVVLLMSLLLHGIIDTKNANNGFWPSFLVILPALFRWGNSSQRKFYILTYTAIFVGCLAVWFGPASIEDTSIACDEAVNVKVGDDEQRPCKYTDVSQVWVNPFQRSDGLEFYCFNRQGDKWERDLNNTFSGSCGSRPVYAGYALSGVNEDALDKSNAKATNRMHANLARLRAKLEEDRSNNIGLPVRTDDDTLLFATWNISDFGTGPRTEEAYVYIAEILSNFDIIAVQELKNKAVLEKLETLLNGNYKSEFSFVSPGKNGNEERLGFIYDTRKVKAGDLSTTLVISSEILSDTPTGQPVRPPFLMNFIVNDREFFILNSHIVAGVSQVNSLTDTLLEKKTSEYDMRIKELRATADEVLEAKGKHFKNAPLIWSGDLNILSLEEGQEKQVLQSSGFYSPDALSKINTHITWPRPHDQIMVNIGHRNKLTHGTSGIFSMFDYFYTDEEFHAYEIEISRFVSKKKVVEKYIDWHRKNGRTIDEELFRNVGTLNSKHYELYRISQMSDHNLKWAEFSINWEK